MLACKGLNLHYVFCNKKLSLCCGFFVTSVPFGIFKEVFFHSKQLQLKLGLNS